MTLKPGVTYRAEFATFDGNGADGRNDPIVRISENGAVYEGRIPYLSPVSRENTRSNSVRLCLIRQQDFGGPVGVRMLCLDSSEFLGFELPDKLQPRVFDNKDEQFPKFARGNIRYGKFVAYSRHGQPSIKLRPSHTGEFAVLQSPAVRKKPIAHEFCLEEVLGQEAMERHRREAARVSEEYLSTIFPNDNMLVRVTGKAGSLSFCEPVVAFYLGDDAMSSTGKVLYTRQEQDVIFDLPIMYPEGRGYLEVDGFQYVPIEVRGAAGLHGRVVRRARIEHFRDGVLKARLERS